VRYRTGCARPSSAVSPSCDDDRLLPPRDAGGSKRRNRFDTGAEAGEGEVLSGGAPTPPEDGGVAGIVPRWEWRTFGESFGAAEGLLDLREVERVQESDELYLLSQESDASVKIRDGLMDVKRLEAVDGNGLEQWRPVLKGSFPLGAADVRTVLGALGVSSRALAREAYTLDELIGEVVETDPALASVAVHKRRVHYRLGDCMAELSEVTAGTRSARTIAVEAEDPELVAATVRELQLADRPNVCLARGLKTMLGLDPVRFAVIDVGTNSVKLHVGERRAGDRWKTVVDRAEVTRLGEGLHETGSLQPAPLQRTADAVVGMVGEARREGAAEIAAAATAGMRLAENSAELVEAVRERCGVGIEVISGEEEARLAYLAATSELDVDLESLVAFDTGGGSTEFTFGRGRRVEERFSVDVGAARYTERFGLDGVVSDDGLSRALEAIAADLARLDGRQRPAALVGMGGALTNLAAVRHGLATYDAEVVHGTVLDRAEIDRQIDLYRTRSAEQRREIVGLQPARAEVILAGACIVQTVLDKLQCDELAVSDRGLRHGLLLERFSAGLRP
jgi:exopolyphosphatase/guanosine-5'-triphosphate,3'-diphosphate pyrophosphatase